MTTDFDLITVTPWRSSGRHRLYVSDRRQSLGFLDESTGTLVLTDARYRPVVEQALRTAGYPNARSRRGEGDHVRSSEAGLRRARPHAAAPGGDEARGDEERTRPRRKESTVARYLKPREPVDGHEGHHIRAARSDAPSRPTEPTDAHDEAPLVVTSDAPLTPAPDTAGTDPEQVWATLAAGRAPRTTSAPRGRRDPSTTLTALLQGEPSPDVVRHVGVGAEIAGLVDADPLWQVLEVDGTEIGHLLIGPGGAFALSTKVHPDATVQIACQSALVDGTPHPWVPVGLRAGRRAGRTLSQACHQTVTVTTLLVIDAGSLTTTLPPPVGVVALDHRDLCRWLRAQPEILTPGTVAMLADAARQSTSWYRR